MNTIPCSSWSSNYNNIKQILKFPNFEIIALNGDLIHPETSTYKHIIHNQIEINYLNLSSFRFDIQTP